MLLCVPARSMNSSAVATMFRSRSHSYLRRRCSSAFFGGYQLPLRWKSHPDAPRPAISCSISRAAGCGGAAIDGSAQSRPSSRNRFTTAFARMVWSTLALRQPVVDGRRHFALGTARDVDADVPALEGEFAVVVAANEPFQRPGGTGRHQVVLLGKDVEHRHVDVAQVHGAAANLDAAIDEAIALVELGDELAERLACLVGRIED